MATARARNRRSRRTRVGITNHPLEEEQRTQENVPPRGTAKGETVPALPARPGAHPPPRDPAPRKKRAKYPMAD